MAKRAASSGCGSSPRARGTRQRHTGSPPHARIIPACAGNTSRPAAPCASVADHPRVRGEHHSRDGDTRRAVGSSPRARGTRERFPWLCQGRRIIPACAGNTITQPPPDCRLTDHPRVRGEHPVVRRMTPPFCGSSPRARGTPAGPFLLYQLRRIIPACAGNTYRWSAFRES